MQKYLFEFYKGKRVLVTGSSGFKGSWLSELLLMTEAKLLGISLKPDDLSLSNLLGHSGRYQNEYFDISDIKKLTSVVRDFQPEIVFHLAAQPIVLASYEDPVGTYMTNVMGTVNLLESLRSVSGVRSVVNVTTDKVYKNKEWIWGYRENEELDGYDPYSNSKSCSELVTATYKRCFFNSLRVPVSTVRAGNVIGGGDFSADRIVPDCVRATQEPKKLVSLRNPFSIRPYQHVLEPIVAYMYLAARQAQDLTIADSYNIGPNASDAVTTEELVGKFCALWGDGMNWSAETLLQPKHEANFLQLDISKIKKTVGWRPCWNINDALLATVEWEKARLNGKDLIDFSQGQIKQYLIDYGDRKI